MDVTVHHPSIYAIINSNRSKYDNNIQFAFVLGIDSAERLLTVNAN